MTWRVYLAHTMDGRKGQQLDEASGSVTITLNGIEDITVTCSEASLAGVERSWWSPWAGAILVTYEDEWSGMERPIAAGPIVKPLQQNRDAQTVTFTARGPGALLERRVVLDQDYGTGEENALRRSVIHWTGVDLGTIVGRIITAATSKRSGWLPIVIPPEQAGTRQRTFEGFNVANNWAWKRIEEITEVIGGPDVMLRPRWDGDDQRRFEWELVTGLEGQPTIPQAHPIVWDTTANGSPVATTDVISDADALAHRVYSTGAGEGAGTEIAVEAVPELPDHMPLLESVVSRSDSEDPAHVREQARSGIVLQGTDQVSLGVHSTRSSPLGSWHVGDAATLVAEGWRNIPDGKHMLRIISADFDLTSSLVKVECQEDVLGEELSW